MNRYPYYVVLYNRIRRIFVNIPKGGFLKNNR